MKITFVVVDITAKGGTERTTAVLANTLVKKGHEVHIVSLFKKNESPVFPLEKDIDILYIIDKSYSIHITPVNRLLLIIQAFFSFRKKFKTGDPDLFIGQNFLANLFLFFSGSSKKTIACEHSLYAIYPYPILIFREYVYKSFYGLVSLTNNDADKFRKRLNNVIVIPNMVTFKTEEKADLTLKRILSIGRLSYEKGYDLLLEAVKDIWKEYPEWHLDIFGEGKMYDYLSEKIRVYRLEKNVFLKGYTSDVVTEYLSSSVYVMPSRYEGFGMVLTEAMSCGLPVVSFNCPDGPVNIIGEDRGILAPPENIGQLRAGLLSLMGSYEKRKEYAEKGRSFVLQNYNSEVIYEKWNALFQSFINDRDYINQ